MRSALVNSSGISSFFHWLAQTVLVASHLVTVTVRVGGAVTMTVGVDVLVDVTVLVTQSILSEVLVMVA